MYSDRRSERRVTRDSNVPSHPRNAPSCRVGAGRIALRIGQRFGEVALQSYDGGRVGRIGDRRWRFCEASQFCAWALDDSPTCGGGPLIVSNDDVVTRERRDGPRSTRPRRVAATSGWMQQLSNVSQYRIRIRTDRGSIDKEKRPRHIGMNPYGSPDVGVRHMWRPGGSHDDDTEIESQP